MTSLVDGMPYAWCNPDNLSFAFLLRDAVVHCSLTPVIAPVRGRR